MGLRHAVITSVDRDDLADGGARHFADVIAPCASATRRPRSRCSPPTSAAPLDALDVVLAARPEVFSHNMETVPRLYREARPGSEFERSLALLAGAAAGATRRVRRPRQDRAHARPGRGRRRAASTLARIRDAGVEILTLGQYLQPTREHLPVRPLGAPRRVRRAARLRARARVRALRGGAAGALELSRARARRRAVLGAGNISGAHVHLRVAAIAQPTDSRQPALDPASDRLSGGAALRRRRHHERRAGYRAHARGAGAAIDHRAARRAPPRSGAGRGDRRRVHPAARGARARRPRGRGLGQAHARRPLDRRRRCAGRRSSDWPRRRRDAADSSASTWRTTPRPTPRSRSIASCGARYDNVGIVLQAYLKRTLDDIEALPPDSSVRLCKGIYVEPPDLVVGGYDAVRANYLRAVDRLLARGAWTAFATHDEWLIRESVERVDRERPRRQRLGAPDAARRGTQAASAARRRGPPHPRLLALRTRVVRLLAAPAAREPAHRDARGARDVRKKLRLRSTPHHDHERRSHPGSLPPGASDRARRHGRGVGGARSDARPSRRGQDHPAQPRRRGAVPRALPVRGALGGGARARARAPDLRLRRRRGRALPGDAVPRERHARRAAQARRR